jgi:alkyldihydroxyacetonephosphate synthase
MIDAPYLYGTFASIGVIVDTIETATTWDRFSDLHGEVVRALRAAVQKACGTKGLVTCRINTFFPDGPAPVYTFVAPARFGVEIDQWAEIRWAAADAVLRAGGTVTHDQGIGRMHRPWFEQESPPGWTSVLQATKRALDPKGILNPGCLIDPLLD